MTSLLSILSGSFVGFSLGLTGGGGAIFAVPLLVYGLSVEPRAAVGVSLASVGATSFAGFVQRWRAGQVEIGIGLLFALAGMAGTPLGVWLSGLMAPEVLLLMFALVMAVVAAQMWRTATHPNESSAVCGTKSEPITTCHRDEAAVLRLTTRCAMLLGLAGVAAGVLSGLFGIGGGFVIVPSLVLFSRMPIHRAIGTSLLTISLVSVSGVVSHLASGRRLPWEIVGWFVVGGVAGLLFGSHLARRLAGPGLQRLFAIAIVTVAIIIVVKGIL